MSFGKYTAFPHGSITPQQLREGDIIQMDDGCNVDGYQSDITRTMVFGKPTQRQIDVWNLEQRAQAAAFAAAKPGAPCESVDAAARKVITDAGFGPDYKVPGLPHRTGHGIGLDIHEWTNFVRGNKTPLRPGMCFSDEPMIAIYGEFGLRLEDCLYITERWREVLHAAEPGDRQAVRLIRRSHGACLAPARHVAEHLGISCRNTIERIRTFIPHYEEMLEAAAAAVTPRRAAWSTSGTVPARSPRACWASRTGRDDRHRRGSGDPRAGRTAARGPRHIDLRFVSGDALPEG